MSVRLRRTSGRALTTLISLVGLLATTVGVTAAAPVSATIPPYGTDPVIVRHSPQPPPKAIDLRAGEHRNFDRVVIDLRGKIPGYDVRYVRRLVYDGSGDPVPLRGRRFIAVALNPASAHDRNGNNLYVGPRLQQLQMPSLRGVAFTGDFEGVVSFGLSLSHRAPFRVFTLSAPSRIVIDVRH
jgi:hypothetical protein